MIMTTSAVMHPSHRSHTSPCASPSSSPHLRPVTIPGPQHIATLRTGSPVTLSPAVSPSAGMTPQRSYARQPQIRPYANNRSFRVKDVEGDTKAFANALVSIVHERSAAGRMGRLNLDDSPTRAEGAGAPPHPKGVDVPSATSSPRKGRSLGPSLAGSWENERVELLVDIPVWSPGCFQDLSTLHALRDTTLSHVHSLLAYMLKEHQIPASYRILARSNMPSSPSASPRILGSANASGGYMGAGMPSLVNKKASLTGGQSEFSPGSGWGCIRLAPSIHCNPRDRSPLRPAVRRSSLVGASPERTRRRSSTNTTHPALTGLHGLAGSNKPFSARHRASSSRTSTGTVSDAPSAPAPAGANAKSGMKLVVEDFAEAIADEDVEEYDGRQRVKLLPGYSSASSSRGGSDDEEEGDSADVLVAQEIERRGAKEGQAFLMTLFGQPALILC